MFPELKLTLSRPCASTMLDKSSVTVNTGIWGTTFLLRQDTDRNGPAPDLTGFRSFVNNDCGMMVAFVVFLHKCDDGTPPF